MGEMRKVILFEISTLESTMWKIYDGFVTVNKVVVHVHDLQQWSKEFVQTLENIHASIAHVQVENVVQRGPASLSQEDQSIDRARECKGLDVDPKL